MTVKECELFACGAEGSELEAEGDEEAYSLAVAVPAYGGA